MALLKEPKQFGGAPTFDYYFKCDGCGKVHYPANQFKPSPPRGWLETRSAGPYDGLMRVQHYCVQCVKRMAEEMTP